MDEQRAIKTAGKEFIRMVRNNMDEGMSLEGAAVTAARDKGVSTGKGLEMRIRAIRSLSVQAFMEA